MRRSRLLKESGPYRVTVSPSTVTVKVIVRRGIWREDDLVRLARDIERLLNGGKTWEEVKK